MAQKSKCGEDINLFGRSNEMASSNIYLYISPHTRKNHNCHVPISVINFPHFCFIYISTLRALREHHCDITSILTHTHTRSDSYQGENEKNFRSEKNPAFHIPFFTGNPCLNIITLSIINRVDFFCSLSRCSTLFFYSLYPFFCHQKNAYLGTGFWLKIKDIFFGYIYGAQNSRIWSIWFNSSCYVSLRGADFENVSIWLNIKNSINFNYINHCYEAVCKN